MDLGYLIREAIASNNRAVKVAIPGRVEKYDADNQRADVRLQLDSPVSDGIGGFVHEEAPIVPNVPVEFNAGGGYSMSFPLVKGDPVQVIFQDVPIGAWLSNGQPGEPGDVRPHHIGNATCYPGGPRPKGEALPNASDQDMVVGSDQFANGRIRLKKGGDAGEIQLGDGATKGVARTGDKTGADMTMAQWIADVSTYINGLVPGSVTPPTDFGEISGGSTHIKARD
jgi:hypothetical protein